MMRTLATLLLGIAIFLGNGCTTHFDRGYEAYQSGDYEQAASFFRLSAEQGDPVAQNNLAFMYRNGVGVAQDYEAAVKWYRLSAEQGVVLARNNLAVMYYNGEESTQDDIYAYMWWNIAAAKGQPGAQENRARVATRRTSAQLAEAQQLARECVAQDYRGC